MKRFFRRIVPIVLALAAVIYFIVPRTANVSAEDVGMRFTSVKVTDAATGETIADLLNGEVPELKVGNTYALNVDYLVRPATSLKLHILRLNWETDYTIRHCRELPSHREILIQQDLKNL